MVIGVVAGAASPVFAAADDQGDAGNRHRIHALSTKPQLVSGGSVLVQVDVPRDDTSVRIDLNL